MMSRPSAIESVQVPHPGMSYNPTFEDHQVLDILLLYTTATVKDNYCKDGNRRGRRGCGT